MTDRTTPLLQKAQECTGTTYASSLAIIASLEGALDMLSPGGELGAQTADLLNQALQVNRALAALQERLAHLTNQAVS